MIIGIKAKVRNLSLLGQWSGLWTEKGTHLEDQFQRIVPRVSSSCLVLKLRKYSGE
jgi:hypothetical protein